MSFKLYANVANLVYGDSGREASGRVLVSVAVGSVSVGSVDSTSVALAVPSSFAISAFSFNASSIFHQSLLLNIQSWWMCEGLWLTK